MGFFDKLKKKLPLDAGVPFMGQAPEQEPEAAQTSAEAPSAESEPVVQGPSFEWDGRVFPLPNGWDHLGMDDWFYQMEVLADRMRNIDQETVQPMLDEDGDELDEEEAFLVQEYGFSSGGAYEAYKNYMVAQWASREGVPWDQCWGRQSGIARERLMAEKAQAMRGGAGGGLLDPVEGVSVEQWAQIQAGLAGGGDLGSMLAQAGIDQQRWDRVSAEWMSRMSSDTSMAITTVYSNAFTGASQGQYSAQAGHAVAQGVGGDLSDEPVSYERFVEITVAQDAASRRGEDPIAALSQLGVTPLDWSNIGAFWSKKVQQNPSHYHQLMLKLEPKYQLQYGIGDGLTSEEREAEIIGTILEMAGTGRAAEMVAYLQKRVPDDAQDFDALDWYLDAACDRCGESGDRNRAQQILWARFPLQDDQSEGVEAYIQSEMDSLF